MNRTRRGALSAGVTAAIVGLALAQTGSAATSCAYSGLTHALTLTHTGGIDTVIARTVPNAQDPSQAPTIAALENGVALACGDPIASQVDTIAFVMKGGIADFVIEEPRRFAPGYSSEAGDSEIEFAVTESQGILGEVILRDGDGAGDVYALGTAGVNVNTDDPVDDADVVLVDVFFTNLAVEGGPGPDAFSAAGGTGTGAAAVRGIRFDGGGGADTLIGGTGDDGFDGGPGDDLIDGGAGAADGVDYGASQGAVTVDLAVSGPQDGGSLGRDTLVRIEDVGGSAFADVLRGDGAVNALLGDAGDDLIEGRDGDDLLDPGDGIDTVSYQSAGAPIAVDLGVTTPQDTRGAGVDRHYAAFENLIGGPGADVLRGTVGANTIEGGPGGDTILGLDGDDALLLRDGVPDTADCGAGNDRATVDPGGIDALTGCEATSDGTAPTTVVPILPVAAGAPTPARRAPATLTGAVRQRLVRGGVAVTVECPDAACSVRAGATVTLRVGSAVRRLSLVPARARLAAGRARVVRIRLGARDLARVRAALAAGRRPVVKVAVALTDSAQTLILRRAITIIG